MNIKSLRDAGYQQAKINSTLEDVARYAMASIPTLGNPNLSRGDQFTKEQRDQLSEGYMLHYGETVKPERLFAIVDGNYVEKTTKEIEKLNVEKFALNVNVAFAVTQQMLNEMKTSDQVRYQLIQGLKTDTNTYVSNRLGDLISKAKKIWRERAGLKAERVQALAFAEFEKKAMDTMLERVRNADARGNDPSANVELTKRRIAAYWSVR